jgi:hypothetical protein
MLRGGLSIDTHGIPEVSSFIRHEQLHWLSNIVRELLENFSRVCDKL